MYRKAAWLRWCCQVDRSRLCLQWCASLADALLNVYDDFCMADLLPDKGKMCTIGKNSLLQLEGRPTLCPTTCNLLADELLTFACTVHIYNK